MTRSEKSLELDIVRAYLECGSVDKVFSGFKYSLPVSYPQVHRILDKWGVVKSVGRGNTNLAEVALFLSEMAHKKIPVGQIYKLMPSTFQTSLETLYRIIHYIRIGITRRVGTSLVITVENDPYSVLVANDISIPRIELGKPYGSLSLPTTFSAKNDTTYNSLLRVLQQEVFSNKVLDNQFPFEILKGNKFTPFAYVDIADVRVAAFHLILPNKFARLDSFSSYKMSNFHFIGVGEFEENYNITSSIRAGTREIISTYSKLVQGRLTLPAHVMLSELNLSLQEA